MFLLSNCTYRHYSIKHSAKDRMDPRPVLYLKMQNIYLHTIFSPTSPSEHNTAATLFFFLLGPNHHYGYKSEGIITVKWRKKGRLGSFFPLSLSFPSPPMQFSWSVGLHIMHENEITSSVQRWRRLLHKTSLCLNMIPSLLISNVVLPHPPCSTPRASFHTRIFHFLSSPHTRSIRGARRFKCNAQYCVAPINQCARAALLIRVITLAWQWYCKTNYIYYSRHPPSANQSRMKSWHK